MLGSLLLLHKSAKPRRRTGRRRAAPQEEGIDELAWLVGGTWVSRPDPQTTVAETCTWGPENAVIFTNVQKKVDGEVAMTAYGIFFYDPTAKGLRSNSVSSQGNLQSAKEIGPDVGGHIWTFASTIDDDPRRNMVTMTKLAADLMTVTVGPMPSEAKSASGTTKKSARGILKTLKYQRQASPP